MLNINYLIKENHTISVQLPEKLEFGKIFTDHVFEMDYDETGGWHNATIKAFENLSLSPATTVFHYGQAVFEGLKAFRMKDGRIGIFRPDIHFQRLNNSCHKLCIPEVDVDFMLEALKELIKTDRNWVPDKEAQSLYIRPLIIGTDPSLGVHASGLYKLIIMLSPVGAYYPEGFKPVKILAQDEFVRAVRKGLGDCKTPANYAASLYAGQDAQKKGFTQVLWLDGVEQKFIEEVGTMNIFIRFKNEIVTPLLTGSILPGVIRATVLELLRKRGENVTERLVSIDEVVSEYEKGNVLSIFGTGTAAVISPVSSLTYKDRTMTFNDGQAGKFEVDLFNEISSIQYGLSPDDNNYISYVD
ncbi:MAG: branched-chain amino acid aminotransferase [Ignavibacteria bacterium]